LTIFTGTASYALQEAMGLARGLGEAGELATLGHDLRTPLTIINGYAQLLKSDELSAEQRARACELILAKCEELNGLIRGFLESRQSEPESKESELQFVGAIKQPA
jgi:signal transduction histidine kinase